MFTGIIEEVGTIQHIEREGGNIHITVASELSDELKIDQSIAHDGVCLTVVAVSAGTHTVTAIQETLDRSKLGHWKTGSRINLERAMLANARLDGHMVQGHVDTTARVISVEEADGSWYFRFAYEAGPDRLLVDKGSICVDGVSLTVVNPTTTEFSVAIIPYTYRHTGFKDLRPGDSVNLEFDIIGKYLAKWASVYGK
ncbi:MAG: riboflavin synthase [Bacteroidota bacterium]